MNTIVISVGKDRPEDDIVSLVEIIKNQFPGQTCKLSDALLIETDIPQAAALFKVIAGVEIKPSSNGKEKKFLCIDCGAPATKENGRCKKCAMRLVGKKNAARAQMLKDQNEIYEASGQSA